MDYYKKTGNVSLTCRYYGISRKTFYYGYKRYDPRNLVSLETRDMTPKHKRQRMMTPEEEANIVA